MSLPGREYELAGKLDGRRHRSVSHDWRVGDRALNRAAAAHGRAMGRTALASGVKGKALDLPETLSGRAWLRTAHRAAPSVELANCPFHILASTHTEMVCGMNLALIDGPGRGDRSRRALLQSSTC